MDKAIPSSPSPGSPSAVPKASRRARERAVFIATFLAPALLIYGAFVVWPLVQALAFSAYRWRGVSNRRTFVGVGNFQRLQADPAFWTAVKNNLWLLAGAGVIVVALAIAVAHALRMPGRAAKALRAIVLFPQMVSMVVVAVLWQFILNPQGLLNSGLRAVGLGGLAHTWLGESAWALPSVGVAFVWAALGFYVMLFAAGLQAIPEEVNEAAALDGSVGWHRFRTVTWPLLWSVKRVATVYLVINVMNLFALVFLMTRGGPNRASEVMLSYLYEQAFVNSQFGYATAVAVGNFLVIMALTLAILFVFRRDPTGARR
jgi:N-acetylglucosamine transport system permease protein